MRYYFLRGERINSFSGLNLYEDHAVERDEIRLKIEKWETKKEREEKKNTNKIGTLDWIRSGSPVASGVHDGKTH